ncbi:MAG: bifunctional 4-hydroxy-2-oxoglutarate aldolase/2-dehydro-3-deoxy-phosphogluconate aldolase [Clostridiales bacterium]|nr:bifunctional 4-hydroxy-2-oxoglutarate aldolase/2-dehydro-3-deoxy-phosphogluconate aldolase [Clostridiales bacterium]
MERLFEKLTRIGIIPVVKIDNADSALGLADALSAGGLPCAEITFRTNAAADAIRIISEKRPDFLVGAGTVLTVDQVKTAVDAGAGFMVSPGLNPKVVTYCIQNGIPVIPGVSSAGDIEAALDLGLSRLKFFPAEAAGGIAFLKALQGPYGMVKFMPTGGINSGNVTQYLALKNVFACGGSWMVDSKLISEGSFHSIEQLTKQAVSVMHGFRLAHVGINADDDAQAESIAGLICSMFDLPLIRKPESFFSGDYIEVMRERGFGRNGHIAIRCNSLKRAMFYLENKGIEFNREGYRVDANGNITVAYFKDEIGGFALHLVE